MINASQDEEGLIWVILVVAREDWRNAWGKISTDIHGEIELSRSENLVSDLYRTQVDVIDPELGSLVQSTIVEGLAFRFSSPEGSELAVYRVAEDGTPLVEVRSLRLLHPGNREIPSAALSVHFDLEDYDVSWR